MGRPPPRTRPTAHRPFQRTGGVPIRHALGGVCHGGEAGDTPRGVQRELRSPSHSGHAPGLYLQPLAFCPLPIHPLPRNRPEFAPTRPTPESASPARFLLFVSPPAAHGRNDQGAGGAGLPPAHARPLLITRVVSDRRFLVVPGASTLPPSFPRPDLSRPASRCRSLPILETRSSSGWCARSDGSLSGAGDTSKCTPGGQGPELTCLRPIQRCYNCRQAGSRCFVIRGDSGSGVPLWADECAPCRERDPGDPCYLLSLYLFQGLVFVIPASFCDGPLGMEEGGDGSLPPLNPVSHLDPCSSERRHADAGSTWNRSWK